MGIIAFKTNPHEIDRATISAIMLRHTVEADTGEISDAEYELAAQSVADELGLKFSDGRIDLRHMSVGTMSYISSQIADAVAAGRPQKAEAAL